MKIKPKLKVGGNVFDVVFVPGEAIEGGVAEVDRDKNLIMISQNLAKSQQEVAYFHEILHCINWEKSEEETEFMAQSLYAVLKDNGMLR